MIPKNLSEIEEIRKECKWMVAKRAVVSGAANLVPLPGVDIAVDIGLLMKLLPAINQKFGLSPEQIDELDPQVRIMIYNLIVTLGTQTAGKVITKQIIVSVLKKFGVKLAGKQVAKFIPIIGQATAFTISVAAMKYVGDTHINECYRLSQQIIKAQRVA